MNYQVTFEWPNGDWTWIDIEAKDFHQAILMALLQCPRECSIKSVVYMTPAQAKANKEYMSRALRGEAVK